MSDLISFISERASYQSVSLASVHTPSDLHYDLISFLSLVQQYEIDFLPITWQAGKPFGSGATAKVSQSLVNLQVTLAFKRGEFEYESGTPKSVEDQVKLYQALTGEVLIAGRLGLRNHPNILKLEGICWEISTMGDDVWPVFVFEKAHYRDLGVFLNSDSGSSLGVLEKLSLCRNIAQGLAVMHDCHVVHGDIKPENVLVFAEQNTIIAKVADFGYAALFAKDGDLLRLPKSQPWVDPNWHSGGHRFSEAIQTDVFSFGMVCLWCLYSDKILKKASIGTVEEEQKQKHLRNLLLDLKSEDALVNMTHGLVTNTTELSAPEKLQLQKFFALTLCKDVTSRATDVKSIICLLQPVKSYKGASNTITVTSGTWPTDASKDSLKDILSGKGSKHVEFSIQKSILQLARTDHRVRESIAKHLSRLALESHCSTCAYNAAREAAFCYTIGFGVPKNLEMAQSILRTKEFSISVIEDLVEKISQNTQYSPYKDHKIVELDNAGFLVAMDYAHEYRTTGSLPTFEVASRNELTYIQESFGEKHILIYLLKTVLISIIKGQGDTRRSEQLEISLVADMSSDPALGPSHILTLSATNNLAFTWREQGRWTEAEDLLKNILERLRIAYGETHMGYLECMSNLAQVYLEQSNLKDAEILYSKVTSMREQILGPENRATVLAKGNLSKVYHQQGQWNKAETLIQSLQRVSSNTLGDKHLSTLTLTMNLASVMSSQTRYQEAFELEDQLYKDCSETLGRDHYFTLIALNNLATTVWYLKRWDEAERLGDEVIEAFKRVRGEDHIQTWTAILNHADTYISQGKLSQAEPILAELVEKALKKFGLEHNFTWICQDKLATTWGLQGRFEYAAQLAEQTVNIRKQKLGEKDPQTLDSMFNLAGILNRQGDHKKACKIMEQVVSLRNVALGPENEHTKRSQTLLRQWQRALHSAPANSSGPFKETLEPDAPK